MRSSSHTSARAVLFAAAALALPAAARAESGPAPCELVRVVPPSSEIPANTAGFAIEYLGYSVDLDGIVLVHVAEDGARTPVPGTLDRYGWQRAELRIDEPLVQGERYVLEHPICSAWSPWTQTRTEYVVGAPAPVPTAAGTLEVSPLYAANDVPGERFRYYFVR